MPPRRFLLDDHYRVLGMLTNVSHEVLRPLQFSPLVSTGLTGDRRSSATSGTGSTTDFDQFPQDFPRKINRQVYLLFTSNKMIINYELRFE